MCLFPMSANLNEDGAIVFTSEGSLKLPCGRCNECISKRAVEWATRAKHEISEHQENSFITLTYNQESLPSSFIIKTDFQKFIKKLRKKLKTKIRYMVSYEYGTKNFRPHMHAIIFGYNPKNQKFLKTTPSGYPLWTSEEINSLWEHGFHSIAEANEKTAYYIASYALKGKSKTIYHPTTGEEVEIADTMDASKRPAIGLNYFLKNAEQLVNTKEPLPRYYIKQLDNPERFLNAEKYPEYVKLHSVINKFPHLAEKYENNMLGGSKVRHTGELYAKFINDRAKANLTSTHFREDHSDLIEKRRLLEKERLKINRDNFVSLTKGRKIC